MRGIGVEDLDIRARTKRVLLAGGLTSASQVVGFGPKHLLQRVPGIGRMAIEEIRSALEKHGIDFSDYKAPQPVRCPHCNGTGVLEP